MALNDRIKKLKSTEATQQPVEQPVSHEITHDYVDGTQKKFDMIRERKSAYQRVMSQPVQDNWYAGEIPTTREIYARIYDIGQNDPDEALKMVSGFSKVQADPTSPWYNPYRKATNPYIDQIAAYGIDVSNINDQWFKDNSYLLTYTPSNAKKASKEQKAAYAYNKIADAYNNTKAVQEEYAALQDEISYLTGWEDRNYSDEDIVELLYGKDGSKFAKKYPTLAKLDASLGIGGDIMNLNAGTDYSKDNVYTMIWRARNGGGTGDYLLDTISSVKGDGNLWQEKAGIAERLNKNDKENYSPYSVGMTLQEEGMYFGVYEFTPEVIERIGQELDYDDATAVKYYQNVLEAEEKTQKLEKELSDLKAWVDERVGWKESADDIISQLYEEDDWGEDLDLNPYNFKDLFDLDDTMTSTKLVGTTRAIDYKRSYIEAYIREQCGGNGDKESIDDKVQKAFNPDAEPIVKDNDVAQDNLQEAAPIIAMEATQAEKDAAFFGGLDASQKAESIANAGMELSPEEVQANYDDTIRTKAKDGYLSAFTTTSEYEAKQEQSEQIRQEIEASKAADEVYRARNDEYMASAEGAIQYDADFVNNLPETYKSHVLRNIQSDDLEQKKNGYRTILQSEPFGFLTETNPGLFRQLENIRDESELQAFLAENPMVTTYAEAFAGNAPEETAEYSGLTDEERNDWLAHIQNISTLEERLGQLEAELADGEAAYNSAKEIRDSLRDDFNAYNSLSDTPDTFLEDQELYYNASKFDTPYGYTDYTIYQDLGSYGYAPEEIQGVAASHIVQFDYEIAKLEDMLADPHKYGLVTLTDVTSDPNGFYDKYGLPLDDNALMAINADPAKYGVTMTATDVEHIKQRIEVDKKYREQATQYLVTTLDDFEEQAEVGKKIVPQSEVTRLNMNALLHDGDPRTLAMNSDWAKQFGMGDGMNAFTDAHSLSMKYVPLMTEDEKNSYFYRLAMFGEDNANAYFQNLIDRDTGIVMHRYASSQMKDAEDYAKSNGGNAAWASVESFGLNVLGGIQSLYNSIDNSIRGVKNTDPYGIRYSASNKRDALRSGATQKFNAWLDKQNLSATDKKIAEMVFEGGFSAGDSAINAMLTGTAFSMIGKAVPALGKVMEWIEAGSDNKLINFTKDAINNWTHALPMALQAADNEYRRVIGANGTREQAEAMYSATLWAESMTEAITYGNIHEMFQKGGTQSLSRFIGDLLVNGAEEAIGEGVNQYWEDTAERHIMGAMSEYSQQVEKLVAAGIPRTKAEQIADKQIVKNAIKSAATGFISSGFSQTGGYVSGMVQKGYNRWQEKQANAMIQRDMIKLDSATGIVSEDTAALLSGILQDDSLMTKAEEYQGKHVYHPKHEIGSHAQAETTTESVTPEATETAVEAPVTETAVTEEKAPATTESVAPEATEEAVEKKKPSKKKKNAPKQTTEATSESAQAEAPAETASKTAPKAETAETAPAAEATPAETQNPAQRKRLGTKALKNYTTDAAGTALVKMINDNEAAVKIFRNLLAVSGNSVLDLKSALKLAALTSGRANRVLSRLIDYAKAGGRITLADVNDLVTAYKIDEQGEGNFRIALELAANVDNYMRSIGVLQEVANNEELANEAKDAKKKVKQANRNAKRTKKTKQKADARVESARGNLQNAVDKQMENPTKEGTAAVQHASKELEAAVNDQNRATEQAEDAEAKAKEAKAEAKSTAKKVTRKARAKAQERVTEIREQAAQEAQAEHEETNAQRNPKIAFRRPVVKHKVGVGGEAVTLTGVFAVRFVNERAEEGRRSREVPKYVYATPEGYISDADLAESQSGWPARDLRELDRAMSMRESENPVKPAVWMTHSLTGEVNGKQVDIIGFAGLFHDEENDEYEPLVMAADGTVYNFYDVDNLQDPFFGGSAEGYFSRQWRENDGPNLPVYEGPIAHGAESDEVQALNIIPAEYEDYAYDAEEEPDYIGETAEFEEAGYDPEQDGPDWEEEPPVEDQFGRDVIMFPEAVMVNTKNGEKIAVGLATNNVGEIFFMAEDGEIVKGTVEDEKSDQVKKWFARYSYIAMDNWQMRSPSTKDDIKEFKNVLYGKSIDLVPYNEDGINKGYKAPEGTTAVYFGNEYVVNGVQRMGAGDKVYYDVIPNDEDGPSLLDADKITSISDEQWAEAAVKALRKASKKAKPETPEVIGEVVEQAPVVKVSQESELPEDLKVKLDSIEFVNDTFYHVKYAAIPNSVTDAKYGNNRIVGVGLGDNGNILKFYTEDEDGVIRDYSKIQIAGTGHDANQFFSDRPALSMWLLEDFIPIAETGVKFKELGAAFKESPIKHLREDITGSNTTTPKAVTPYVPTEKDYTEGKVNVATGERLQNWQNLKNHGKVAPRSEDAEKYLNKSKFPTSKQFKDFFEKHNAFESYQYTLDDKGNPRIFWRGIGKLSHHLFGVLESGKETGIIKNFFAASAEGVMPYSQSNDILKLRNIDNWETAKAAMQDLGYDLVIAKNDEGQIGYQVVSKANDTYVAAKGLMNTWFAEDELETFRRSYGGNVMVDGVQAGYIASEHPASLDAKNQNWKFITATCTAPDGTTITATKSTDSWADWAFQHGADALFIENVEDGGPIILEAITNKPNMFKSVWNNGEWNWEEDRYLALHTTEGDVKSTAKTEKIDGNLITVKRVDVQPETPTEKQAKKVITDLKSAQDIMQRLCKRLKIGNFFGTNEFGNLPRTAKGFYNPRANYAVGRVAESGNPEVGTHELGHGLAKLLKMTGNQKLVDGLIRINEEKAKNGEGRIDLTKYTPGQLKDEAFAEFVKYYLTDEATARNMAGDEFIAQFESALAKDRDVWNAVMDAKDEFLRLNMATFAQRLCAIIKDGKDADKLTFKEFMQNAVGMLVDKSVSAEDVNHLIRRLNGGKNLPIDQNLRSMTLLSNHSQKQAIYMLTQNLVDANGTVVLDKDGNSLGFGNMLKRVGFVGTEENIKLLETYMLALHSIARDEQGKPVYADSVGTPEERQAFIDEIKRTRPDIVGAEEAFQAFRHNFLQKWMVDTGMWGENGQALLDKFEKMYEHYVPTFRVGGNVDIMNAYGMKGGKHYTTYQAKGSTQNIYNPLYSFFGMVDQIVSMVNQNRAAQTFDNLFHQYEGLGFWARQVPQSADITAGYTRKLTKLLENGKKSGEISDDLMESILDLTGNLPHQVKESNGMLTIHRKNGQVVKYQFTNEGQELFKLLSGVQQTSNIKALETVGKLTRTMSMLTTGSNPLFAARNAVRDFQTSVNYGTWASNYAKGIKRWMQAFAEIARGESEDVQQYFALGGGGWTRITQNNRKSMEEVSGEIFKSDKSKREKLKEFWAEDKAIEGSTAKWALKAIWKTMTMETLNERIEQTSRFAEYKYGNHDLSTVEGRQEAFLAAQDVTVDFSRSGNSELASILKKLVPFFNASTQGVYRTARQFSEAERGMIGDTLGETAENFAHSRAAARLTKTVVNTALVSALSSLLILKFGDDDDKDEFANILSSGIKANHIILPNPFSAFGKGSENKDSGEPPFIRIPLAQDPLGYAVHAAVTNALWGGTADEYAISLAATADVILDNLNPLGSGTIWQPLIDVSHNRTWYGSRLVRSVMSDWTDPSGQYNEDTPELFRVIGRLINVSPEAVEYLATQYTGFIGSVAFPALSVDEQGRAGGLGAIFNSITKKWTADPYSSNDATNRFYDYAANLETIKGEAKQERPQGLLLRSLTQDDVNAAYREAEEMLSSKGIIGTTKKAISEAYGKIDKINSNADLTDSQKATLVREVQKGMNDTVEEANRQLEVFEKKYIKGESLTDLVFGGLIKGVTEGKYAHIPTTEERLLDTFQEDADEAYMKQAQEVYKATGSEAAFPHPEQTLSITNRRKVKDEYRISDEEWPEYQQTYKDAYVRYMGKYEKRWNSMNTDKKKQILSNAHAAGNEAMRKRYTREHPDIDQNFTGQYGLGNIDLNNRPVVQNEDGSISTEESFSFYDEDTGKEILVPTIINGKSVDQDDAIEHYYQTGEYLGMFDTPAQADAYAEKLHNRQDWYYHR